MGENNFIAYIELYIGVAIINLIGLILIITKAKSNTKKFTIIGLLPIIFRYYIYIYVDYYT